jgi:hypothetical protein
MAPTSTQVLKDGLAIAGVSGWYEWPQGLMKNHNMTLSTKLVGSYLAGAAITLLVGLAGVYGLRHAVANADSIVHKSKERGLFLAQSIDLARLGQVNFKKQVQAWKDILLRGRDRAAYDKYLSEFGQQEEMTQKNLATLKSSLASAGVSTAGVQEFLGLHLELGAKYREALKSYDPAKPDAGEVVDKLVKGIDRRPTDALDNIVEVVRQFDAEATKELEARFRAEAT